MTDTGNTMIHVPIAQVHTTSIYRYIYPYVLINNFHDRYPLRYITYCNSHREQRASSIYTQELSTTHLLSPSISICIVYTCIIVYVVLLFPLTDSHPLSPFMDINENQLVRFTFVIFLLLLSLTRRLCFY